MLLQICLNMFMIYVGNFKDWIDPKIMDIMLNSPGEKRPIESEKNTDRKQEVVLKWTDAGYNLDKLSWEFYYDNHIGWLDPPIAVGSRFKWWFSKMNPGEMFPLHIDSFPDSEKNIKRYWMAMQDMIPGHIFIYDGKPLEYSAGDMFIFDEARDWHGAANLGFVPKIAYQLVVFDENQV